MENSSSSLLSATLRHPRFKDALILLSGAALASMITSFARRRRTPSSKKPSITSSSPEHLTILESKLAIDSLLASQYGKPQDILPPDAINDPFIMKCLQYPVNMSILVERHCNALLDFSGEREPPIALDIGCTVGRTTFELLKSGFSQVYGVDTSTCIRTANAIKDKSWARYSLIHEGELMAEYTAMLPEDVEAERATFIHVDDFTFISKALSQQQAFDAIVVSHNVLISRIDHPRKFLKQLTDLVKPHGIVVITSDFLWKESCVEKKEWIGGYKTEDGKERSAIDMLTSEMQPQFQLIAQEEYPCLTVDSKRRMTIGLSIATVWKRL